ncbi:MAG: YigZ family protein [Cyclobacteriaceae bacterium]
MNFKTIEESVEGFYKEKGSKFYAHAFPVESLEEVRTRLNELRKQYYDARHHCFAYILGMKQQSVRANDDGEPNHSAGDPILGQIKSFELTNTLVVVVRYFGGTKLGVGGLVHAYKTAAQDALSKAAKRIIFPTCHIKVSFPYDDTSSVEKALDELEVKIIDRHYTENCEIEGLIREEWYERFVANFELLSDVIVEEC